jgi:hypothetical protein
MSAEELSIRVDGCFAAFLAEMLRAVASSDVRSSGLGMYASMHLRRKGTVRNGPLEKSVLARGIPVGGDSVGDRADENLVGYVDDRFTSRSEDCDSGSELA